MRITQIIKGIKSAYNSFIRPCVSHLGYKSPSALIQLPCQIVGYANVYLDENVSIGPNSILYAPSRKIHFMRNSFTGPRLFISTGNHYSRVGLLMRFDDEDKEKAALGHDVTIHEDVWIGANVSILCKHVGRGSICACGAVCTKDVPPYAIVGGYPQKCLNLVSRLMKYYNMKLYCTNLMKDTAKRN